VASGGLSDIWHMFPGWRSPVKPGTDPPMFHVEHGQPCGPLATGCADSTRGRPRSPCARVALRTAADGLVVDGATRPCRRARVQREGDVRPASGSGAGLRPTWHRQVNCSLVTGSGAESDALRITMRLVLQRRNDGRTIEPSPAPFPAGATIRCAAPWWARSSSTSSRRRGQPRLPAPGLRRPVPRGCGRLLRHPGRWGGHCGACPAPWTACPERSTPGRTTRAVTMSPERQPPRVRVISSVMFAVVRDGCAGWRTFRIDTLPTP
jgi:hypothetical protein